MVAPASEAQGRPVRASMLFVSTYLFPVVGFPLLTFAWWLLSHGSWPFVVVVMGVPVVFGYVMPGIAIHLMKRWRMTGGPRMGSYYLHHGFVYASKLALVLLLAVRSLDSIQSSLDGLAVMFVTGAATAFGGWWHDVHAVRAGKIAIDGGSEALTNFAPPSYFAMGATYAAVSLGAYRTLAQNESALAWVFPSGLAVLCIVPTLVFLAVDPPARRVLRQRFSSGFRV